MRAGTIAVAGTRSALGVSPPNDAIHPSPTMRLACGFEPQPQPIYQGAELRMLMQRLVSRVYPDQHRAGIPPL
jgi:hypothetical protein